MGGMGGMMAVDDDLSLGAKKVQPASPATPAAAPAAAPSPRRSPAKTTKAVKPINVQPAAGQSIADAWDRYFADQEERLAEREAKPSEFAAALRDHSAQVRETVRQLMRAEKYTEVADLIQAALRHGQGDTWMYEGLALALRADSLNKGVLPAQNEQLERALLSAVDFAESEDQVVLIAAYMAQAGFERRALGLYQQVGHSNPNRAEVFTQALALAKKLDDIDAIQWACVGILSQEWTGDQREVFETAYRIGRDTYNRLLAADRRQQAESFDAAARKAMQRDCKVVVTWTGDADIDLSVEEPSGAVVSQQQPRSISGGVYLGDVASAEGKGGTKGFSETYVCPLGFDGEYRVLIKNVWGRPTSGKVTLDIYTHFGSVQQKLVHEQIPLAEKNAVVVFDLKEGRRNEALPEAQVANVAKVQNAVNRAVLAQQLPANPQVGQAVAGSLGTTNALGFVPGFFLRGAVGYRPIITPLSSGATLFTNAVISADRRYVRISPSPQFTQITEVNTFNFVSGQGMTQGQGQGGVGQGGGQGGFGGGASGGGNFL
jgi:hypothetical protein